MRFLSRCAHCTRVNSKSWIWYRRCSSSKVNGSSKFVWRKLVMPEASTVKRANAARRAGKSPSTQAGEYVRETIRHVRQGVHGARSTKQIIAIGLSKARRAGVRLPPPAAGTVSRQTRRQAERELRDARSHKTARPSAKRSRATLRALRREDHSAATSSALSRQAHRSAMKRRS